MKRRIERSVFEQLERLGVHETSDFVGEVLSKDALAIPVVRSPTALLKRFPFVVVENDGSNATCFVYVKNMEHIDVCMASGIELVKARPSHSVFKMPGKGYEVFLRILEILGLVSSYEIESARWIELKNGTK